MNRSYVLEPRDKTGVFLGMSAGELVFVGGGVLLGVVMHLGGAPVVISAVPVIVGAALAKVRIGGASLREWIRLAAGWVIGRTLRRHRWNAPLPLFGAVGLPKAEMPPVLADVDVIEIETDGRPLAAVRDRRAGRLTAVLPVDGPQFACLDPHGQDALLQAWGDALGANASAGSPVVQIGWSDSAGPSDLADHSAWAAGRFQATGSRVGDPASYQQLVSDVSAVALVHDTVVWITIDGRRVGDTHGKPGDRAARHLPVAVEDLIAALATAGLRTTGPLPAAGLWRLLRCRIDPRDASMRGHTGSLAERLGLVGPHNGAPLAVESTQREVWIDGMAHRVFWVESWPKRALMGEWLSAFLTAGEARTMTVMHRPIEPARSQRRIESQANKHAANRARKQEKARRVTEADRRSEQAVHDLEAEIASGHAETLYLGLVTACAPSVDELDTRCRHLAQTARAAGISLRALHTRHDAAWAASLPFGLTEPGLLDLVGV